MKLLRYQTDTGRPGLGALQDGGVISLDGLGFPSMMSLILGGEAALERVRQELALDETKLLAPLERPGKYLAIGMNYREHAEEADARRCWYCSGSTSLPPGGR